LKDRQHNGQKKNYKGSTKHTHKTKDRVTLTPLKTQVINFPKQQILSRTVPVYDTYNGSIDPNIQG
jgi:hypothetical protein